MLTPAGQGRSLHEPHHSLSAAKPDFPGHFALEFIRGAKHEGDPFSH
jgi:hypothetical protein